MEEIELLNKIIAYAIADGGDMGGPYLSCEEDLFTILNDYIWYRNWQDSFTIKPKEVTLKHGSYAASYSNIPQIVEI